MKIPLNVRAESGGGVAVQRMVRRQHGFTSTAIIPLRPINGGRQWKCRREDNGFEFVMPTNFILETFTRIGPVGESHSPDLGRRAGASNAEVSHSRAENQKP